MCKGCPPFTFFPPRIFPLMYTYLPAFWVAIVHELPFGFAKTCFGSYSGPIDSILRRSNLSFGCPALRSIKLPPWAWFLSLFVLFSSFIISCFFKPPPLGVSFYRSGALPLRDKKVFHCELLLAGSFFVRLPPLCVPLRIDPEKPPLNTPFTRRKLPFV